MSRRTAKSRYPYDALLSEVCVGWGYCGCFNDGKPLHVDMFIPTEGSVSADQFVEWVFLAENLDPSLAPRSHRRGLRAAFIKYMGREVVDASVFRRHVRAGTDDK
jgi:hypothetical protein